MRTRSSPSEGAVVDADVPAVWTGELADAVSGAADKGSGMPKEVPESIAGV